MAPRKVWGRSGWSLRWSGLGFGLVGLCFAGGRGVAQTPGPLRLTVRPHQMATGTQTPPAGLYPLDSLPGYLAYVPDQCAGTRRCPLVLSLHPGSTNAWYVLRRWSPAMDRYGMILLTLSCYRGPCGIYDREGIDAALKQILRTWAIDPDKIAIIGHSGSTTGSLEFAVDNPDVFNRVAPLSGIGTGGLTLEETEAILDRLDPKNKTLEFRWEDNWNTASGQRRHLELTRILRQRGYPVKHIVGFHNHGYQWEFFDDVIRWLQESWAIPNPAARPVPPLVADPLPLLTDSALSKLEAFWTRFFEEPDSIRITGRRAHLREYTLPFGPERPAMVMVDMAALAAAYPSVAAALKAAGLTAGEHDAYRAALLGGLVAAELGEEGGDGDWRGVLGVPATDTTSVLVKNVQYLQALLQCGTCEGRKHLNWLMDFARRGEQKTMMYLP